MTERSSRVPEPVGAGVALIEAATPLVYRTNAFRVTGLPVDATPRDVSRQLQKTAMLERLGHSAQGMSGPLALNPAADGDAVRDAMQRLRDPERRLIEELFWFWPRRFGESSKDEALDAVNRGDLGTSTKIWVERAGTPSEAGVAIHNLAVLAHALALDYEYALGQGHTSRNLIDQRDRNWRPALERWVALVGHEAFWARFAERIRTLDDPRLGGSTVRQIRTSLALAIVSITARLALQAAERGNSMETARLVDLLHKSGFGREVVDEAFRSAIQPVRDRVRLMCESAAAEAMRVPGEGANVARRLLEQALPTVAILDRLLPAGDAMRDGAHDEVALRTENSLAAYARETGNWKVIQEVHEFARRLAASPSARQRLERSSEAITSNLLYSMCWFCKTNRADDAAAVLVPMHGNVTRTPSKLINDLRVDPQLLGLSGTHVKWQQFTARVPRCTTCALAEKKTRALRNRGLVIGALAGIIGCVSLVDQSDESTGLGLLVAGAGAGVGALIGWLLGHSQEPAGMSPLTAKTEFPPIQERFKLGWAVGEKPSGVQ